MKVSNRGQNYLPDGWVTNKLGEVGEFKNGINKDKDSFGYGSLFVNISDIYTSNIVNASRLSRLNANAKEIETYKLNYGDIVLVRSSVKPEGVGYPILFKTANEPVLFCGFTIRYRPDQNKLNSQYLLYTLRSSMTRRKVLAKSTVSANTNINQESYSSIDILIPTLPEQEKIACILMTVDNVIDKTEQLIEKYKNVKQGLIQDLLTRGIQPDGKLRPSYNDAPELFSETQLGYIPKQWLVKKLGDITTFIKDGTHGSFTDVDEGIPLLSAKDIRDGEVVISKDCRKISIEDYKSIHKYYEIREYDILLTIVGTIGRVSIVRSTIDKFTLQRSVAIIRLENSNLSEYMSYFLQHRIFQEQLERNINASAQGGVYLGSLNKLLVAYPNDPEELNNINNILKSMDNKIKAEQKYLSKLMEIKRGLMSDLLTGKVRVKIKEDGDE